MKSIYLFVIGLFLSVSVFSQIAPTNINTTNHQQRENRSVYLKYNTGIGISIYRDFATSPLYYSGIILSTDFSRLRTGFNKETVVHFSHFYGLYSSYYNDHIAQSTVLGVSQSYAMMYCIKYSKNKKTNLKVGGMLKSLFLVRINSSLMNNGFGYEWFPTLFGSAKLTVDVSRKQEKHKRFLLWDYTLKPRRKDFSFLLNIGLINASLRNGFAYLGQSVVENDFRLFDGYQFKLFSGARVQSSLAYTIHLYNKNALEFSYDWEVLTAKNDFSLFEMSSHVLKLSFLFNTK
ncbi:MAG: hypothetical protein CSA94_00755 [Bacteroidetes bacterium]|nr:MAG: hypothetical protein CSA94_00755 [Bacteroidota bacterium]